MTPVFPQTLIIESAGEPAARDRVVRESLEDRGYRVVEITHDRPIDEQVADYTDVFGEE